jgi:polysaccharide chain length determinant protein (PEP-CTERM system associated)
MAEVVDIEKIHYYVRLVIKHRWLVIIPFCLAMAAGIYLALTMPRIYQANTLILVEPQRVPTNFVKSIVSQDIESRISTISQQILSRTNLEKIMAEFSLFSEPQHADKFLEDKLEALRKRIQIQVSNARARRQGNDTFSISYKGGDPLTTMKVTNALATYFIDENLKVRESHATGTNLFLDDELKSVRARLQKIEEAIKNYRTAYMGELPEQLQSNLTILSRLQEQLNGKQKNLRETRAAMASLQQRIDLTPDFGAMDSLVSFDFEDESIGGDSLQLEELNEQLNQLRLRYTDRHPDVVRIKGLIAKLEAQEEADAREGEPEPVPGEEELLGDSTGLGFQNPQNFQLDEMQNDIRQQRAEIADLTQQIEMYQRRVENTPKREQEMFSLKRDYDNIQESYDSLVQRKLEAEIAVNMEKKQKGEQFRIIDHAVLPQKPHSPDVQLLFLGSMAIGLGLGAALIFLLDLSNTALKMPNDYETRFGLTVLTTIPNIDDARRRAFRRINWALTAVSMSMAAALIGCFAVLTIKGVDSTLAFLKSYVGS